METAARAGATRFPLDATLDEACLRPPGETGWPSVRSAAPGTTARDLVGLLTAPLRQLVRRVRPEGKAPASARHHTWWPSRSEGRRHRPRSRGEERGQLTDDYLEALYGHPFDWDRWVGTYVLPYVEPA